ncbi:GNAT family N-acetyltransferase [Aeromicrobium sp.]|uniref:GNAT family N-acetyltransferase n=1 Tax=Aeromicrobium sp. TaxID=1871063 RepID=UPI0019B7A9AD|nr:GNAT family N-acetyltransferase [Aeromicrobium sp.]MBC7631888.1 GNAT family N-acetyltransferase [Aeromicrobium sp.]
MPDDVRTSIAERWLKVWAHTRGLDVSTVDGWPFVHVGSVTRETELLCVEPGTETFAELMRHVLGRPRAMLTVLATDARPYAALLLPANIRVDRDDETLMVTSLSRMPIPPLGSGLTARWDIDGNSATYAVEWGGSLAAEGTIGVLGRDATLDAVETTPAFQRRGLARHVMAVVTEYALDAGADTGILAATPQGRRLYEALGWRPTLQMLSLMGSKPADADSGA